MSIFVILIFLVTQGIIHKTDLLMIGPVIHSKLQDCANVQAV